jgi:hypothetical protein
MIQNDFIITNAFLHAKNELKISKLKLLFAFASYKIKYLRIHLPKYLQVCLLKIIKMLMKEVNYGPNMETYMESHRL